MKRKSQAGQLNKIRKKSCRDRTTKLSSKALDLKDSQSIREQAEPYRLATVKFPIDALSPIWSVGTNRPINESHKRKLGGMFKDQGLRRSDIGNRLRVACNAEDVQKMKEVIGLVGVKDNVSVSFESVQTKEPAWPYFKDWMQVVGKKAELMAGHHRIEALKEMLDRSRSGDDERWWLCDIYNKDTLPTPLHIRLRANREDVTLPDSHGQIWAEVATLASSDDTLFKGNYKEVENDVVEILGLAGKTRFPAKRLVSLWRNKSWKEMITRWCSFPVGQATFNISSFEWMVSCRLDDYWFSFLNKAIDSATRVRRSYGIEIEPQDWIRLANLSEKSSSNEIMTLFYPKLDEDPYFDTLEPRRRDFLTMLDDEKYKDFYLLILTKSDLRFPDVHSLIKTSRLEGKVMSTVVTHVGYWLNQKPTIILERNASKPLLRMEFLPALETKYGKFANKKSIELEHELLVYVQEQMDTLTDKTAEHFLEQLPTSTEQDYNIRFNDSTWKNILIIVHAMVGPYFQNEAVARFNHEDPNTISSKPLKTIVHGVCDFISRNPEVSQSRVLSKKAAIEVLHTKLRSIIAEWAVEQCDKALRVDSSEWQPAELAQLKAERARYAVLWNAEMKHVDSASSYEDSNELVDESILPTAMATRTAPTIQGDLTAARREVEEIQEGKTGIGAVHERESAVSHTSDVRECDDVDDGQQAIVSEGSNHSLKRAKVRRQTKQGHESRHITAEVDTLGKRQPRALQSVQNGWRGRPVAHASALIRP